MTDAPLLTEFRDGIAFLTLNRPDDLNALSAPVAYALADAMDRIEAERARAVVITGAGAAFCAGGDLKEFKGYLEAGDFAAFEAMIRETNAIFARLEALAVPVVAAVNGAVVAGGLELILCCDMVVAAEGAMIGDGHLKFGVLPGGGSAARLPRRIAASLAAEMLLTGDLKPAEWWAAAGLVNQVVPAAQLMETAEALARRTVRHSAPAVADMKSMLRAMPDMSAAEAVAHELDVFANHLRREDFLEGMRAFSEKRKPVYRDR